MTISEPRKKGLEEGAYGLVTIGGAILKYLGGGLKIAFGVSTVGLGSLFLSGAAIYSVIKGAASLYKSAFEENDDKSLEYAGRGLLYEAKALVTTQIPWLQAIVSLTGSHERITEDRYLRRDFPELIAYEQMRRQQQSEEQERADSDESEEPEE